MIALMSSWYNNIYRLVLHQIPFSYSTWNSFSSLSIKYGLFNPHDVPYDGDVVQICPIIEMRMTENASDVDVYRIRSIIGGQIIVFTQTNCETICWKAVHGTLQKTDDGIVLHLILFM